MTYLEELLTEFLRYAGNGGLNLGLDLYGNNIDDSTSGILGLEIYTPASDILSASNANRILWGRTGNDIILPLIRGPRSPSAESLNITIMVGDVEFPQLENPPGRDWRNTFALGDWLGPYLGAGDRMSDGWSDIAVIVDFNPALDRIQLFGDRSRYALIQEEGLGFALQYVGDQTEVIALIATTEELDLGGEYFRYAGETRPTLSTESSDGFIQLGTDGLELSTRIHVDAQDSIYLTFQSSGSLGRKNNGSSDVVLAKYNRSGEPILLSQFGSAGADVPWSIVSDSHGNIYICGYSTGALVDDEDFIGSQGWLAKLDSAGRLLWIRNIEVPPESSGNVGLGADLALGPNETIYVSGVINVPTDQGRFPLVQVDSVLAIFTSDGEQVITNQIGSSGRADFDDTYTLGIDQVGNAYRAGFYTRPFPEERVDDLPTFGRYDIYLAQTSPEGTDGWTRYFGTDDFEWATSVATDLNNNIYVGGWTLGSFDSTTPNLGSYDGWISKFDPQGNQQWIVQFGTEGEDAVTALATDADGAIYATGYTAGSLTSLPNHGESDLWFMKFDSDGNEVFRTQHGTQGDDRAHDLAVTQERVYISGVTDGSLGRGNLGAYDAFLATFSTADGARVELRKDQEGEQAQNDFVSGTEDVDFLTGQSASNVFYGYGGDDTIFASGKRNLIYGGQGSDWMVLSPEAIDGIVIPTLMDTVLDHRDRVFSFDIDNDYIVYPFLRDSSIQYMGKSESFSQELLERELGEHFAPYSAALLLADTSAYIILNDSSAGFHADDDGVLEITGFAGDPLALSIASSL